MVAFMAGSPLRNTSNMLGGVRLDSRSVIDKPNAPQVGNIFVSVNLTDTKVTSAALVLASLSASFVLVRD